MLFKDGKFATFERTGLLRGLVSISPCLRKNRRLELNSETVAIKINLLGTDRPSLTNEVRIASRSR